MSETLWKFTNASKFCEAKRTSKAADARSVNRTCDADAGFNARVEKTLKAAKEKIQNALASGAALEKFRENIKLQGGDPKICDEPGNPFGAKTSSKFR